MNAKVKENNMVSPYFLFFLIHATQTGVFVLSFQSDIIKGAGHDAWIPVIVLGLLMNVIFFMMQYILKQSSAGDILSLHRDIFGKILGGTFNIMLACYFSIASLYALHTYIDILQIWVFDGIASWEFSLLLTILVFYIVAGGFRIVTSVAFWGVVIPSILLLTLLYLLYYAETSYLSPPFQHGWRDLMVSAKEATPLYFGFETMLVFLPFIKGREKAFKWGHIALLYTTFLYAMITIITFVFFTQGKLEHLTWPTLTMIKIIKFPFLERFEFIFIFTWLLVIMPVICVYLWSAIRSIKVTIPKITPTYVLIALLIVFHFVNSELVELKFTYQLNSIVIFGGLLLIFGYIPLLFLITLVRKRLKKQQ